MKPTGTETGGGAWPLASAAASARASSQYDRAADAAVPVSQYRVMLSRMLSRSYWEDARALAAALASGQAPPPVTVPVGFTTFPGEIWASPRRWVEAVYPDLAYFNEVDRGGHFAAWEEPELFSSEVRAAFSSLR